MDGRLENFLPVGGHPEYSDPVTLWEASGSVSEPLAQGGYLSLTESMIGFDKFVATIAPDATGVESSRYEFTLQSLKDTPPRLFIYADVNFSTTLVLNYGGDKQINITGFSQLGWTKSGVLKIEGYRRNIAERPFGAALSDMIASAISNGIMYSQTLYEGEAIGDGRQVTLSYPYNEYDFLLVQSDFGVSGASDRYDLPPALIPVSAFSNPNKSISVGERTDGTNGVWVGINKNNITLNNLGISTETRGGWVTPGVYKITGIKGTPFTQNEIGVNRAQPWTEVPAEDYILPFAKVQDQTGSLSMLYARYPDPYCYQIVGIARIKVSSSTELNTNSARPTIKLPQDVIDRALPHAFTIATTDYSIGCYSIYNPGDDHLKTLTGKFFGAGAESNTWIMINHIIPLKPKS